MKFCALLFFFVLGFSTIQAQCNYTLVLGDNYGDGWNGGQMILVQNGDTIAFLNGPGLNFGNGANDTTVIVSVTPGLPVNLIWNAAGSYPSEMEFRPFQCQIIQVHWLYPLYSLPHQLVHLAMEIQLREIRFQAMVSHCVLVPQPCFHFKTQHWVRE